MKHCNSRSRTVNAIVEAAIVEKELRSVHGLCALSPSIVTGALLSVDQHSTRPSSTTESPSDAVLHPRREVKEQTKGEQLASGLGSTAAPLVHLLAVARFLDR